MSEIQFEQEDGGLETLTLDLLRGPGELSGADDEVVDVGENDHELATRVGRGRLERWVGNGGRVGSRSRRRLGWHGGESQGELHD
jgi:hypothetical protein